MFTSLSCQLDNSGCRESLELFIFIVHSFLFLKNKMHSYSNYREIRRCAPSFSNYPDALATAFAFAEAGPPLETAVALAWALACEVGALPVTWANA